MRAPRETLRRACANPTKEIFIREGLRAFCMRQNWVLMQWTVRWTRAASALKFAESLWSFARPCRDAFAGTPNLQARFRAGRDRWRLFRPGSGDRRQLWSAV